jgi:hypothetical protein
MKRTPITMVLALVGVAGCNSPTPPAPGSAAETKAVTTPAPAAKPAAAPQFVAVSPKTGATSEPTKVAGAWEFVTHKDSMSDEVFTVVGVESRSEENGIADETVQTRLMLRCHNDGLDAIYKWNTVLIPEFTREDYDGSYRFDSEPATTGRFEALKGSGGAFIDANAFLARTGGTVTIRAKGMSDERLTSTFDLTGITDALAKLPCVKRVEPAVDRPAEPTQTP